MIPKSPEKTKSALDVLNEIYEISSDYENYEDEKDLYKMLEEIMKLLNDNHWRLNIHPNEEKK